MKTKAIIFSFLTLALSIALFPTDASALTFSPVRFEINGDSGKPIEKEITLTNETDATIVLFSSFRNFQAQGESGIPDFSETDTSGLASWMKTQPEVTIAPKASVTIPFQVYIPSNTEPGGYFGAVFFSTTPPTTSTNEVSIGARTGPIVLLTVNGDIKEKGGIVEFNTKDDKHFYTSLPVGFFYRFRNDGTDRIKPYGDIHIRNILGLGNIEVSANKVEGNILPGSVRRFEVAWEKKSDNSLDDNEASGKEKSKGFFKAVSDEWNNFAFGRYKAHLSLTYGNTKDHADASVVFWVIPWHLLAVLLFIASILYFLIKRFIRNYNRFIIKQATIALEQMEEQKISHERPRHKV